MTDQENTNEEQQPKKRGQRKGKSRRKGSGSVFRRPDRKGGKEWIAQIILEDGKTKQRYFKTQAEADIALNEMLYKQRQGTLATGPKQKLRDFLEQWFEEVHSPTLRLSSRLRYRGVLNNHILPVLGDIPVQGLTAQKVQSFYASKLKEGLSTSSLHTIHKVLHSALNTAVRWNLVARNVCDAVSLPSETSRKVVPLTLEQAQHLLAVVRGHQLEALITLALTTAMRHGELTGLQWSDIDFDEESLSIRRTVNWLGRYKYVEGEPKTEQSRRKISLPSFVPPLLKEHRIRQKEARLKAGTSWQDRNLVFCTRRGGFLYPDVLLRQFHKLLDEADLPHMRLHDLRHSAATILMSMKVPIKVIQELLGHSSVVITLNVYGHVLSSMQDEAVDEMERLFGKDEKDEGRDSG